MKYLTVRNTSGGNHGHQLKDLIGGYTISKIFGFKYLHSYYPYLESFAVGHGEDKVESVDENIKYVRYGGPFWNGISFENLSKMFDKWSDYRGEDVLVTLENALRVHPCQTIRWFKDGLIKDNVFSLVYDSLSYKYSAKHKLVKNSFANDEINIAVHINRGESYDRVKYPEHFVSDLNARYMFDLDYFSNIFDQLRGILGANKYKIHIYTESLNSEEIVQRYEGDSDIILHIGKNRDEGDYDMVRDIFHDFVTCDILVPCNSSFGVMAAYYRKGRPTIYHSHVHLFDLPETDFFATDKDGIFDTDRFENYINRLSRNF